MRGDQLARQWRTIRAIEASPKGLTVIEIAQREEIGMRTIYHELEASQAAGFPPVQREIPKSQALGFRRSLQTQSPFPFSARPQIKKIFLLSSFF